jgi:DNA-binding NarL/FixJ family response regulator
VAKSVLIVDDSAIVRAVIRLAFERNNRFCVCGEAVDGRDAIEKARQVKPDLIVLDFLMPRMNGIDAARILTQEMRSVPLILFTIHSVEIIRSIAWEAGFKAVISKDQGMDSLVEQGQSLLDNRSPYE